MKPTLVGIHSRPDALIEATRDFDRGRLSREDFLKALKNAEEMLIKEQADLGFSPTVDGMYNWQDLFRPLVETFNGLALGPLTRFFDNNTFYKKPLIINKISYRSGFKKYVKGSKLVIPGPYTFLKLSSNNFYEDELELMRDYSNSIYEVVKELGVKHVQLNEPSLTCAEPEDCHLDLIAEAFKRLRSVGEAVVHIYFGDCDKALGLQERGVDFIGIDVVEGQPVELDTKILLGVVDSRNTLLESPEHLIRMVEKFDDVVYIAPNCDMEFLPYEYALRKMKLLSIVAGETR